MDAADLTIEELAAHLAGEGALVGLDVGSRTIGVAVSDPARRIATPVETIRRKKFSDDAKRLLEIAGSRNAAAMVIGLPLNMNGTEGPRVQSTRAFRRNLARLTDMPAVYWDERLSTAAVTRTLLDADSSRKRREEVVDKMAAAYILQGALDRLAALQRQSGGNR